MRLTAARFVVSLFEAISATDAERRGSTTSFAVTSAAARLPRDRDAALAAFGNRGGVAVPEAPAEAASGSYADDRLCCACSNRWRHNCARLRGGGQDVGRPDAPRCLPLARIGSNLVARRRDRRGGEQEVQVSGVIDEAVPERHVAKTADDGWRIGRR